VALRERCTELAKEARRTNLLARRTTLGADRVFEYQDDTDLRDTSDVYNNEEAWHDWETERGNTGESDEMRSRIQRQLEEEFLRFDTLTAAERDEINCFIELSIQEELNADDTSARSEDDRDLEASAYLGGEELAVDPSDASNDDGVLCPICKRDYLKQRHEEIVCSCGVRLFAVVRLLLLLLVI
jgi:hypothetical protein